MKSLDKCSGILNKGDRKYSKDEVKGIREFMYFIAESLLEIHKSQIDEKS